MNGMVDDILMLMNLDSGSLALRPTDFAVGALVSEAVAESPGGSEVAVEVRTDAVAHADPFHLRQVLANLLSNAGRYGAPPIEVLVEKIAERVTVSVIDHGEGVPADFAPKLFERFSRGTTGSAGSQPGSGFGLYIVRQLVESNGGTIDYAPHEPHGSRFTISLPCSPDAV
jgi:signal transduction histidine kinase